MAWVKIDDNCPEHPKQLALAEKDPKNGAAAAWMWVCGLAYCNRSKRRDGVIPTVKVPGLYPSPRPMHLAALLVEVGLWEIVDGGFFVHDYHDYQPDAEKADAIRAARSAAGQKGGQASAAARAKQTPSKAQATIAANAHQTGSNLLEANQANSQANGKQDPSNGPKQNPTPSRPDPVEELNKYTAGAPARNGTAADFSKGLVDTAWRKACGGIYAPDGCGELALSLEAIFRSPESMEPIRRATSDVETPLDFSIAAVLAYQRIRAGSDPGFVPELTPFRMREKLGEVQLVLRGERNPEEERRLRHASRSGGAKPAARTNPKPRGVDPGADFSNQTETTDEAIR